jgi:hypothetical protein
MSEMSFQICGLGRPCQVCVGMSAMQPVPERWTRWDEVGLQARPVRRAGGAGGVVDITGVWWDFSTWAFKSWVLWDSLRCREISSFGNIMETEGIGEDHLRITMSAVSAAFSMISVSSKVPLAMLTLEYLSVNSLEVLRRRAVTYKEGNLWTKASNTLPPMKPVAPVLLRGR